MDEKPNCWKCKYFERIRMSAFCHVEGKITKLPKRAWYYGSIDFCTGFSPQTNGERKEEREDDR